MVSILLRRIYIGNPGNSQLCDTNVPIFFQRILLAMRSISFTFVESARPKHLMIRAQRKCEIVGVDTMLLNIMEPITEDQLE